MIAMTTMAATAPFEMPPWTAGELGAGAAAGMLPPVRVSPVSEPLGSVVAGTCGGGGGAGDGLCTGCRKMTVYIGDGASPSSCKVCGATAGRAGGGGAGADPSAGERCAVSGADAGMMCAALACGGGGMLGAGAGAAATANACTSGADAGAGTGVAGDKAFSADPGLDAGVPAIACTLGAGPAAGPGAEACPDAGGGGASEEMAEATVGGGCVGGDGGAIGGSGSTGGCGASAPCSGGGCAVTFCRSCL